MLIKVTSCYAGIPYGTIVPVVDQRPCPPGPNEYIVEYNGERQTVIGYHAVVTASTTPDPLPLLATVDWERVNCVLALVVEP